MQAAKLYSGDPAQQRPSDDELASMARALANSLAKIPGLPHQLLTQAFDLSNYLAKPTVPVRSATSDMYNVVMDSETRQVEVEVGIKFAASIPYTLLQAKGGRAMAEHTMDCFHLAARSRIIQDLIGELQNTNELINHYSE